MCIVDKHKQSVYLIEKALQRGCNVHLFVDKWPQMHSNVEKIYKRLQREYSTFELKRQKSRRNPVGAQNSKIYLTPRWLAVGSFDMSQSARELNNEVGIVTNKNEMIDEMYSYFEMYH